MCTVILRAQSSLPLETALAPGIEEFRGLALNALENVEALDNNCHMETSWVFSSIDVELGRLANLLEDDFYFLL